MPINKKPERSQKFAFFRPKRPPTISFFGGTSFFRCYLIFEHRSTLNGNAAKEILLAAQLDNSIETHRRFRICMQRQCLRRDWSSGRENQNEIEVRACEVAQVFWIQDPQFPSSQDIRRIADLTFLACGAFVQKQDWLKQLNCVRQRAIRNRPTILSECLAKSPERKTPLR